MLTANYHYPDSSNSSAVPTNLPIDHTPDDLASLKTSIPLGEIWERNILEALAATVGQRHSDSQSYRVHGLDSSTWGDPDEWIKIQWFRALLGPHKTAVLEQYPALERIVSEVQIGELESYYLLRNDPDIREYLSRHPQLLSFLLDSYQQLRKYFGSEPDFGLELVNDPEAEHPTDFLFVYIRTSLDVDEALNHLEQFDENWYLDQFDDFGALVNFNLEIYEL